MNRYLTLILSVLLLMAACRKDDDGGDEPSPVTPESDTTVGEGKFEVMIVFAPGQLGDRGYADDIMSGISFLNSLYANDGDSLDVRFITPWDRDDMRHSVKDWAMSPESPFIDFEYEKRLLVLTEPFMLSVLDTIDTDLRAADDVLVLKVYEQDIVDAEKKYNIPGHIYGFNISLVNGLRRYCKLIRDICDDPEKWELDDAIADNIPIMRLYDVEFAPPRDSIYEVLTEEFPEAHIQQLSIASKAGENVYASMGVTSVAQYTYIMAEFMQQLCQYDYQPFSIINYGAGNAGVDYLMIGRALQSQNSIIPLFIDAEPNDLPNRYSIIRRFGLNLMTWVFSWMHDDSGLERMVYIDGWSACKDNLPGSETSEDDEDK